MARENVWIDINKEMPPENERQFIAVDDSGYVAVGRYNWLSRHGDEPGIYLPAKYGMGMRVSYWMPVPDLPSMVYKDKKEVV